MATCGTPPPRFQAGYPPKWLQAIMGHASITTTLDLYGRVSSEDAVVRCRLTSL
jgi:integrase